MANSFKSSLLCQLGKETLKTPFCGCAIVVMSYFRLNEAAGSCLYLEDEQLNVSCRVIDDVMVYR
jgi:hypothetical protein